MNNQDIIFRNGCRQWHTHLDRCIRANNVNEAKGLLAVISRYLAQWKESLVAAKIETRAAQKRILECRAKEASIQMKLRMLGQLVKFAETSFAKKENNERRAERRELTMKEETVKEEEDNGGDNE